MGSGKLVFGSELLGKGRVSGVDVTAGCLIGVIAALVIALGIYSLHVISKYNVFHTNFGLLVRSRIVAEMVANSVHLVFSAPVTLLQPTDVPIGFNIAVYTVSYSAVMSACLTQFFIAVNRSVAVCLPLKYNRIFTKRFCWILIRVTWIYGLASGSIFLVIPCNMKGYSPRLYDYAPASCPPQIAASFPQVGMASLRFCFLVCVLTMAFDAATLGRITHLKLTVNTRVVDRDRKLNIRFFFQCMIQNITMVSSIAFVFVVASSNFFSDAIRHIINFDALFFAHFCNGNEGEECISDCVVFIDDLFSTDSNILSKNGKELSGNFSFVSATFHEHAHSRILRITDGKLGQEFVINQNHTKVKKGVEKNKKYLARLMVCLEWTTDEVVEVDKDLFKRILGCVGELTVAATFLTSEFPQESQILKMFRWKV
ncbi:hypothetical protein QR680_016893 [Steinernema hermaphroditum]|uniref:G-protein coupled receptors family 1 profile domain-containing protein n=1 Tax=Steinernema hermaphroditum TaxID=289476 RepID=A0AA39HEL9_9BILA|nr:hypothetical protein QR680_016893 [Steinernema hermaphroditum]